MGIHTEGQLPPPPGMGQGKPEAQEGKRSVCLHGEEEEQPKNAVLRGRPPHLEGVGQAGGMQAAWGGVVPSEKALCSLVGYTPGC